jgi:hypothetical protein
MFVLDQPEVDENTGGGDGDEGVDITSDGVQVEISVRGASFIGTAGNDAETEANASTEVPAADAAIAIEV